MSDEQTTDALARKAIEKWRELDPDGVDEETLVAVIVGKLMLVKAADQTTLIDPTAPLITSELDEALMRKTLLKCYSARQGFRISVEHYRYLAEQIIALREAQRRFRVQR